MCARAWGALHVLAWGLLWLAQVELHSWQRHSQSVVLTAAWRAGVSSVVEQAWADASRCGLAENSHQHGRERIVCLFVVRRFTVHSCMLIVVVLLGVGLAWRPNRGWLIIADDVHSRVSLPLIGNSVSG